MTVPFTIQDCNQRDSLHLTQSQLTEASLKMTNPFTGGWIWWWGGTGIDIIYDDSCDPIRHSWHSRQWISCCWELSAMAFPFSLSKLTISASWSLKSLLSPLISSCAWTCSSMILACARVWYGWRGRTGILSTVYFERFNPCFFCKETDQVNFLWISVNLMSFIYA